MSTAPLEAAEAATPSHRSFLLRRLHSLAGVVPVGVFLVEHLWINAHALYGRDAFNRAVGEIQKLPALPLLELFGIALPLAFHALYGMVIAARGSVNVQRYPYTANWTYLLQRASGVVALLFIAVHLWQYRVAKALGTLVWPDFYGQLAVDLNRPVLFALYVTGVTASVFHFANGLWLAGQTWGLCASPRARRGSALGCVVVGLALWALGVDTLLHFALRPGGVLPWPGTGP
jgi:succinate dehydrogenase / fumarate reductase cytochrome b subunit